MDTRSQRPDVQLVSDFPPALRTLQDSLAPFDDVLFGDDIVRPCLKYRSVRSAARSVSELESTEHQDEIVRPILRLPGGVRNHTRSCSESDIERPVKTDKNIIRPEIRTYTACGSPVFEKSSHRTNLRKLGFLPGVKLCTEDCDSVFPEETPLKNSRLMDNGSQEHRTPCTYRREFAFTDSIQKGENSCSPTELTWNNPGVENIYRTPRKLRDSHTGICDYPENVLHEQLLSKTIKPQSTEYEAGKTICKRKLDFDSPMADDNNTKRQRQSCTCAVMEGHFLQMAQFGYKHVKRSDTTPAGLEQFKTELTRTNEILRDSVEILREVKSMCGCNQFFRNRLTS